MLLQPQTNYFPSKVLGGLIDMKAPQLFCGGFRPPPGIQPLVVKQNYKRKKLHRSNEKALKENGARKRI